MDHALRVNVHEKDRRKMQRHGSVSLLAELFRQRLTMVEHQLSVDKHDNTSRLVFTARLRPQFQTPTVPNARRASIAARRCCSSTAAARWCCSPLPVSAYHSIGGCCRNGKFQNVSMYLLRQFCLNRVEFFLQYTGDIDAKNDGPEF